MNELLNPFPDPREADESGLLCYGGDLSVDLLLCAYERGIFPWPVDDQTPILWFSPPERGILEFADLHVSRTLKKTQRQNAWHMTQNRDFAAVIQSCQQMPRPGQSGTWITDELRYIYLDLHNRGYAHSIEVYNAQEQLVGGIYGVQSQKYFSAESMFFIDSGASKLAFIYLVEWLKQQGFTWMDVQMVTAVSKSLGCKSISREEFLARIGA